MTGLNHLRVMRKWTAILALLALIVSVTTPMPGMSFAGMPSDICGLGANSGFDSGPANESGPIHHHCDLCAVQCHLGWLPPSAEGDLAFVHFAGTRIGLVQAVGFVSTIRSFSSHIPRAPPVFA